MCCAKMTEYCSILLSAFLSIRSNIPIGSKVKINCYAVVLFKNPLYSICPKDYILTIPSFYVLSNEYASYS